MLLYHPPVIIQYKENLILLQINYVFFSSPLVNSDHFKVVWILSVSHYAQNKIFITYLIIYFWKLHSFQAFWQYDNHELKLYRLFLINLGIHSSREVRDHRVSICLPLFECLISEYNNLFLIDIKLIYYNVGHLQFQCKF